MVFTRSWCAIGTPIMEQKARWALINLVQLSAGLLHLTNIYIIIFDNLLVGSGLFSVTFALLATKQE